MMKMIQTLGYRVGICSVWHPRFKSVHKHRKCIDCPFCFFSELLQVRDQQGGDVHPLHPQTVWHASAGGELHRYSRISHSWTRAERVTNARLTLSGLRVCLQRPRSPCCYTGSCCTGTSVLWRSSCIILLRPSGTARRDSAGKSSTTSTRGRWGRDTVSVGFRGHELLH